MTISLKQKMPFYLMRQEAVATNETTGATNLMASRGLEHSYNKLTSKCQSVKMWPIDHFLLCSKKDERFLVVLLAQHAWHGRHARKSGQQLPERDH